MRLRRAIAGRLENIRRRLGFTTLSSFQEDLVLRSGQKFSYTATRNYHDVDTEKGRMPPVEYLNAVSGAYRVRLAWLVRGEGSLWEETGRTDRRIQSRIEALEGAHPGIINWPESAKESLLDLLKHQVGDDPGIPEMEADLVRIVMFPLGAWGFQSLEELNGRDRLAFFTAMFAALLVASRGDIDGNRLGEYPDSKLPRLRRLLRGKDPNPSEEELRRFEARQRLIDNLRNPDEEPPP